MLIAIIIIVILILAVLIGLAVVYHKAFYSPYRGEDEIAAKPFLKDDKLFQEILRQAKILSEIPCRRVYIRSYDGLRLSGRYYHRSDTAPLCICFHGYRGSPLRDFSVMAQFLINEGYNVLLPEERAHFRSGGHTITFGIRERRDVLSWIAYANQRFGDQIPIYLFGISMGAGTVLMASGLELPENVKIICADCPFNSPKEILCHVAKWYFPNEKLAWILIYLSALIYGHLNIRKEITAANAVKNSKKPILIVHGGKDDFVPPEMSEQIRDANPDMIELHIFPDAVHGVSYFSDPEKYIAVVRDFIRRNG